MDTERATAESTIEAYLDAVRTGSRQQFDRAFAQGATVSHRSVADDSIQTSSLDAFVDLVQSLIKQHGTVEETLDQLTIDVADTVGAARARFTLKLGDQEASGHDVFSLAKSSDGWLITHKLYSM
ncbi:MAG: nuclear transport factor 2 family protein [Streptosporangiaceae bacterium]